MILQTIRDADFGLSHAATQARRERQAARAVLFDEKRNIALLHVTKDHYHKLPGGGLETGESIMDALRREVIEEAGCAIKNVRELGEIEEFRDKFNLHQISYCFIAEVDGQKGKPDFEQDEIDNGFELVWMNLAAAIKTLASEAGVKDYEGKFIQKRDLTLLKEAEKIIKFLKTIAA